MATRHPVTEFTIQGFRGLRDLTLEGAGQVNLLVGGTNAGKTSVLEALSLLADPLNPRVWVQAANRREPSPLAALRSSVVDRLRCLFPAQEHGAVLPVSFRCQGSHPIEHVKATMVALRGLRRAMQSVPNDEGGEQKVEAEVERNGLELQVDVTVTHSQMSFFPESARVEIWEHEPILSRSPRRTNLPAIRFVTPYDHWLRHPPAQGFSQATLSGEENEIVGLLQRLEPSITGARVIATQMEPDLYLYDSAAGYLPVSSFGDGMRRVLALALAVPRARGGILLVDEIETGLHVSLLQRVFAWLWSACHEYDVQLFATTHSLEALDAMLSADTTPEEDTVVYQFLFTDGKRIVKRFGEQQVRRIRYERGLDLR